MDKEKLLKNRLVSIRDQLNFIGIGITFDTDNDIFTLDLSKSNRTQAGIMNIIEFVWMYKYTTRNGNRMVEISMHPYAPPERIDVTVKPLGIKCDYYLEFIENVVLNIYRTMDDITIEDYYKDRLSKGYAIGPIKIPFDKNDSTHNQVRTAIPANMERNNYLYRDKISEIDHVKTTFICPNCFGRVSFNLKSETTFSITSDIENFDIERSRTTFIPICLNCNQSMFECDEDFVDKIIKLNLLGIITEYCCSGHKDSIDRIHNGQRKEVEDYSYPYLMINLSETAPDKINIILTKVLQEKRNLDVMFMDENPFLRISPKLPKGVNLSDEISEVDQEYMKNTLFKFIDIIIMFFYKEEDR